MGGIKLAFYNDFVILNKNTELKCFQISSVKEWIYLTKFTEAYLITSYPQGEIETIVDRKFILNQDFELLNDLDFQYQYILPLGNLQYKQDSYPVNDIIPFTGSLNGNHNYIKNINLIDCDNNGLFGVIKSGSIKNLFIQNIVISEGIYNGCLFGKGYDTEICNVSIFGNLILKGTYCSGIGPIFEGSGKDIRICADGYIKSNYKSLISYNFFGQLENVNIISNISEDINCFNTINGSFKNSNIISFHTLKKPFYSDTKYHQIFNCYYFQLNNEALYPLQNIQQSYYRNLNQVTYTQDILNLLYWTKIGDFYYLKDVFNYSNENLFDSNNIQYYDLKNNISNSKHIYINENKLFINKNICSFNYDELMEKCKKMEYILYKEKEKNRKYNEFKIRNNKIKIKNILSIFENNNLGTTQNINNLDNIELYDSESSYETSDDENNNELNEIANDIINESLLIDNKLKNN